jgi:hypothetical protein
MADDMGRVLFRVDCNPFRVGSRFGEVPVAARGLPLAIFCQPFGLNRTPPRQSREPVRWPQLRGGSPSQRRQAANLSRSADRHFAVRNDTQTLSQQVTYDKSHRWMAPRDFSHVTSHG